MSERRQTYANASHIREFRQYAERSYTRLFLDMSKVYGAIVEDASQDRPKLFLLINGLGAVEIMWDYHYGEILAYFEGKLPCQTP